MSYIWQPDDGFPPPSDLVEDIKDMLVTALANRGLPHGDSVPEMINALVNAVDNSRAEVIACHNCWDDFTAKLVEVMPGLHRSPLFSQAEAIVVEIQRLRQREVDLLNSIGQLTR